MVVPLARKLNFFWIKLLRYLNGRQHPPLESKSSHTKTPSFCKYSKLCKIVVQWSISSFTSVTNKSHIFLKIEIHKLSPDKTIPHCELLSNDQTLVGWYKDILILYQMLDFDFEGIYLWIMLKISWAIIFWKDC